MKTLSRDGARSPEPPQPFSELFVWLSYLPCCGLGMFPAGPDHGVRETDNAEPPEDSVH